jgi:hypothetical protein
MFEHRMLKKIFGCKKDEVTGSGAGCIIRSFMIWPPHQIFCGLSNKEGLDGRGIWHAWGIGETGCKETTWKI